MTAPEPTPAVERAWLAISPSKRLEALRDVRYALTAALDVEEMARVTRLDALPGAEDRLCVVCGRRDIVSAVVHVFRSVVSLAFHCHRDACREDATAHGYLDVTDDARTLGLLPKEEVSGRG